MSTRPPQGSRLEPIPPRAVTPADRPQSLPVPLTSFVGRDLETGTIVDLLRRPDVRLVTLTGPGGVGKTRLAIRVAEHLAADFPDGIWFVPLAPVRSSALVPSTVAQVIGLRQSGQPSVEGGLQAFLRDGSVLLVFDNFEHLLDAAPLLTVLLTTCPRLRCLVTSREPLRISGEQEYPVPLLPFPESADASAAQIAEMEAVRLFVDRARSVRPEFALDDANVAEVAAICRLLDGLPLAIELAVARTRLFSPDAIRARMEEPGGVSRLLTDGPRDAPERHRTLSNTVAWSYNLLSPGQQALFRRLSAFSGGFTMEVADIVAGGGAPRGADGASPPVVTSVFHDLSSIVDMSLLQTDPTAVGEPRFTMLETIRAFGQEQLVASGEAEAVHDRHADAFVDLAERAEREMLAGEQVDWLARLTADQANLRAALQWLIERQDSRRAQRLAGALGPFWHRHGAWVEGRVWLERALALPDASDASDAASLAVRAKALAAAGWLALYQNAFPVSEAMLEESLACHRRLGRTGPLADVLICRGLLARAVGAYPRAIELYEEALALARDLGDRAAIAEALFQLALSVREGGDYGQATVLCEEALALHREAGHRRGEAVALLGLGDVARDLGAPAEIRARCEASLALFREMDDPWGEAFSLHNLAIAAYLEHDLDRAKRLGEESLGIFRPLGVDANVAEVQASVGVMLCAMDDLAGAASALAESLRLARRSGPRWVVPASLEGLANVAARTRQPRLAVELASRAAALRNEIGVPVRPNWRDDLERALATARAALGDRGFSDAWATAGSRPLEQAVAEALAATADERIRAEPRSDASGHAEPPGGLSSREREVLALLVAGRTDREIGEALFISPRTASKHVGSILAKLDVATRAEAAVRAVRDGLA